MPEIIPAHDQEKRELSLREIRQLILTRCQPPRLTAESQRIIQRQRLSIKNFNQLMNTPFPEQVGWTHAQPIMIPLTMSSIKVKSRDKFHT